MRRYLALLILALMPLAAQAQAPSQSNAAEIPRGHDGAWLVVPPKGPRIASPQPTTITPVRLIATTTEPFEVKLEGPAKATTGGFAVFVTKPPQGVARWRNDLPAGAIPLELTDNSGRTVLCFFGPPVGVYRFTLAVQLATTATAENPTGLDPFAESSLVVEVGGAVPPVVVVPDPPTPPVPPQPPAPVSGKRLVLLLRETDDDTPAVGRMVIGLRSGASANYLGSKGHTLDMLDINSVGPDGKPAALIEMYRPEIAGMVLPVLVVADAVTGKLITKQTLPPTATAADVVEAVKKAGG